MKVIIDGVEYAPTRQVLGVVEGHNVYEGNMLYFEGALLRATAFYSFADKGWSWNPPKPRTITIELLREVAEFITRYDRPFYIDKMQEAARVCKEALKEKP